VRRMNSVAMAGSVQRVAVQDRQRLFRDGLSLLLNAEPDVEVCASAGTSGDLVALTEGQRLDVVILELDVADWDSCRLVAALRKRHEGLAVIGTVESEGWAQVRAYQAGVRTILPRRGGIRTLLETVRGVRHAGQIVESADNVISLDERRSSVLTRREIEVLDAIGGGSTTRDVAMLMGISPKTVENHKQRIFSKLGVQNQAHAVAVAVRQGLVDPSRRLSTPA
jgi:DNA-binding NarL/FixJ family response regulator